MDREADEEADDDEDDLNLNLDTHDSGGILAFADIWKSTFVLLNLGIS